MPPGGSEAEMSAATAPASASVAASNSEFRTCITRIHCRGSGSVGPEACTCMNVSASHKVRSISLTRFPRAPAALDRVFSRGSWRQPIKAGIAGCSEGYSAALCHQQRISHISLFSGAATSGAGQGIIGGQTPTARQGAELSTSMVQALDPTPVACRQQVPVEGSVAEDKARELARIVVVVSGAPAKR